MSFLQRSPEKFENLAASLSTTFLYHSYEADSDQPYRASFVEAVGADYAHDFQGFAPAPAGIATETVRFEVVGSTTPADLDATLDTIMATCRRIGLGKLFSIDSAGTRRWCYARIMSRPVAQVRIQAWMMQPVVLVFTRLSDWFSTTATTDSDTISSSPTVLTWANGGNIPAKFMVIRIRANGAAGFTNVSITNTTNGYTWSSTRDSASANSEVRINTELLSVEYSNDNGSTYADDYALVTLGALQVGIMQLEPGNNSITVTCDGTPDFDLEISFYAPWA